jgi:lipoprotein LpqH
MEVDLVTMRFVVAAVGVSIVSGVAACSSPPPAPPLQPGTLAAGTAEVTVNGKDLGLTDAVACAQEGSQTTITTGDQDAGTTTVMDNAEGLTTKSVSIHNVGGFTGSYWEDLDGNADVHATGRTFVFTGTAWGFDTDKPNRRTTGTFAIRAAC